VRLLDEKHRLFGLVNPIDALVVIVLIAAALVAYGLLSDEPEPEVETQTIVYSLWCRKMPGSVEGLVSVGDTVSKLGSSTIGTVVGVTTQPSVLEQMDEGETVVRESKLLTDMVITVEAEAQETDLGYLVNGILLRNNTVLAVNTKTFEYSNGQILDLEAVVD
jgi:hypothetical protein